MESLLKALMIKWNGNAAAELRTLCKGGLWAAEAIRKGTNNDRVGVDSGENYVMYSFPADDSEKTMSSTLEKPLMDFLISVPGEDDSQVAIQIRDEFVRVFDDVVLELDTGDEGTALNMVSMTRQNVGILQKDPDEGYIVPITYEIIYG